jgi:glutaminyl-tRNA synthetase
MYDFIHPLSDALEHITHSLCTLEFEDHRPLYNWAVENCSVPAVPRQIEFARLNINYSVMSKRKLLQLVEEKHVEGWDDPRMPTISAMRRRGYPPAAIRNFCNTIGIAKNDNIIDYGLLEFHVREELNKSTKRVMGVLEPLKVTITNWEEGRKEEIDAPFHPQDSSFGQRTLMIEKTIYIEQSDFLKDPPSPKKWFRLGPDRRVRLRYGMIIHCDEFIEDDEGNVVELKCHYIEDSFHGKTPEGEKKPKGIIHWVNASTAKEVEVRLYDRLFSVENPDGDKEKNFLEFLNPNSCKVVQALVEPALLDLPASEQVQFERMGYFIQDSKLSTPKKPIFNKIVGLRDSWAKKK